MAFDVMQRQEDRPFLWAKRNSHFRSQSFATVAGLIADCAHGLRDLGLAPGDRVCLVAENRPEWLVADLGIMAAGGVTVPAYITNTVEDHVHILGDSGARFVIVSTPALLARVLPAAEQVASVERVILIDSDPPEHPHKPVQSWASLLTEGRVLRGDDPPGPLHDAGRGDLACLIYTSGTGGAPKGVMLSHGAILCNAMGACDLLYELDDRMPDDEVFLSFLPLSHSYEHTAGQFFPLSIGAQIYYAESVEALARNMAEVKPTIMTAVPRLYETLHGRVLSGLRGQPKLRQKLFWKTVELGRKKHLRGCLSLPERLVDSVLDRLVRSKVRERFGGRNKALISGGAPLNHDIGLFFTALGLRLLQGYGQTETAPIVSCNRAHKIKLETVGPAFPGVEVKIADDGEILVRGELAMLGYWGDPEATAAALQDGWVHTGDVGEIDADGYIRITDRKKDIIVLSGGDTLSPQRVEGMLQLAPEIAQAMVAGDKQPYLVALIVPDAEAARDWAKSLGKPTDLASVAADPAFHAHIERVLEATNKHLGRPEQVRRFALVPEPFTTENAMLTPSMKIRRHVIREAYAAQLAALHP
ncbi:MAG: long-chain fatty acid--CoA ligase [Alphaproteobacteria bacterium]|nr:long-chain fatty acid--CoA ligase [Alphaproteobacteria bacterium]